VDASLPNMPGYGLNEYMLVLTPHEELRKKIQQIKGEFSKEYKCPQALWGKPHSLLVRFSQFEMMEERIVNRLKTVAMGFHPIRVEAKNFGSYPSHSIFIQIVSREPIRELIQEIRLTQRILKVDNEHKPYFTDDAHILISNNLLPWQYEAGWQEFSQCQFTGRFIAESMLLLKRRSGEKQWQILQRLEFQNLPVANRQGELFG